MKKIELEEIKQGLMEIQEITNKQEYLVSSYVNQRLAKMYPLIDKEIHRMESTGVEVNCLKVLIMHYKPDSKISFTDLINTEIAKLTQNDYKVIDCEIKDDLHTAIIKYTN